MQEIPKPAANIPLKKEVVLMFVKNHMTGNPITIRPEDSISHATRLLRENNIRHLPVISHGKLVGIVTQTDILKVSASPATSLSIWELNYLIAKLTVREAMVTNVVTVSPESPIEEAAYLMRQHKVGSLPVVDAAGHLVGIVTETDIFDALLDALGALEDIKRITIDSEDRAGTLAKIGSIFASHAINIRSLVVFHPEEGKAQMVIRTQAENLDEAIEELRRAGLSVQISG